jgi:hypothetical protein
MSRSPGCGRRREGREGGGVGPLICGSAQIACRNLAPVGTALKDPFFPRIDKTRNETFSVNVDIFPPKKGSTPSTWFIR